MEDYNEESGLSTNTIDDQIAEEELINSFTDCTFEKSKGSKRKVPAYVQKYVEEEHKLMFKLEKDEIDDFDNVSVFTESTSKSSVKSDYVSSQRLDHLQRTYDPLSPRTSDLVIFLIKQDIVTKIKENPIVIIHAPTGSGKTTQVPQFILENEFEKRNFCNIIVTQPRRIAAVSIAKRVCNERQWPLGTLVGYKVGMENKTSKDTRITYCTTGVLLRKLLSAKHLLDYTHIIIDEIHERDQDVDFLLILIRKLFWLNSKTVKIILMSATLNCKTFADYFSSPCDGKLAPAPILKLDVESRFKIQTYYLDDLKSIGEIPDVSFNRPSYGELKQICISLLQSFDPNQKSLQLERHQQTVLIFLPGFWEIEELYNIMSSSTYEEFKWDIAVLHSTLTIEEQEKIFEPVADGYRRVILATNIAESSITVPNVKYVIDFCFTKLLTTSHQTNFPFLNLTWASKGSCKQRAGRAGRLMNGEVFRLVPRKMFEKNFDEETLPEILRISLERLVLYVKELNMGEPEAILALSLDPPDLTNIQTTILLLKELGALFNPPNFENPLDGELSRLGYLMSILPVEVQVAKLIILGHIFGVLREAIIIGACLSSSNMFSKAFSRQNEVYRGKLKWSSGSWSDLIIYLQAYQSWQTKKLNKFFENKMVERAWAKRNFLNLRVLCEVHMLVRELTMRLSKENIFPLEQAEGNQDFGFKNALMLKVVIAGAFYPNYFITSKKQLSIPECDRLKRIAPYDPFRTVYLQGWKMSHKKGYIYAKRIQKLFADCVPNAEQQIHVNFDEFSERVYVTFPHASNKENSENDLENVLINGKMSTSVYKALRKRRRENFKIKVLNNDNFSDNFYGTSEFVNDEFVASMISSDLPKIDVKKIPIKILEVFDPSKFWIINIEPKLRRQYNYIQNSAKSMSEPFKQYTALGSLVLAPYAKKQNEYYRGIIEYSYYSRGVRIASVFLIDIAVKVYVPFSQIRKITSSSDLLTLPALALKCTLASIKPSDIKSWNGQWTPEAISEFINLISTRDLYGEIYSVVNNVVALTLHSQNICINDKLIENGHATYKIESSMSRKNNVARNTLEELSPERIERINKLQFSQEYIPYSYVDSPEESKCKIMVTLRGPYSPLEIVLEHMIYKTQGNKVNIDSNSINAVLLDSSPEENRESFIVAASLSQHLDSCSLNLYNTTAMPNIEGMSSLMSLLFASQIELAADIMSSRYVGAICGLGMHAETGEAIFPNHDMVVKFNVKIDDEDLFMINKLRHWMNTSLQPIKDNADVEKETVECQKMCRDLLMEILTRERKKQKPYRQGLYDNQWGAIPETEILCPFNPQLNVKNIFPLHNGRELSESGFGLNKELENLNELRVFVEERDPNRQYIITCKLCDEKLYGINYARNHLVGPKHLAKEEVIKKKMREKHRGIPGFSFN